MTALALAAVLLLAGRRLNPVYLLKDYWFDWKTYHPTTSVYRLRPAR